MILYIIPMIFTLMGGVNQQLIDKSTIDNFALDRYLGTWYEIARFDNRFERNLDYATASYTMLPSGKIEVINRGFNTHTKQWHESDGVAKLTSQSGALKVSFFLWFYSDYLVLEVGNDYSWALVGSSSDDMLWILSRESSLPAQTLEYIISLAQERGYQTDMFIFPKQQKN
ncbi:MAG: lipocalin family protein [Rikenellaceae bacterium]